MEPAAKKAKASTETVKLGLTKRKVADELRVHCGGYKLRGGCVPWRFAVDAPVAAADAGPAAVPAIELMLIEGINSRGQWSFPGGSLDTGEEVSICARRETEEESGVQGVLGCFLGKFAIDSKKKSDGVDPLTPLSAHF